MTDISHEEIGDACESCGNSPSMCDCRRCKDCKDKFAKEDMPFDLCPDCYDNYASMDLEDQFDKAAQL